MWHETTFQSWLTADPDRLARLGVGELFFVGNAGRLKRLVDMVFISAEDALVLVEVKNERTTREVIGQALEYAARLQDATLEEVADAYGVDMLRLKRSPALSSKRCIVFVAPEFDVTCHVTVPYLRPLAGDKGVTFHLVRAISDNGKDFDVKPD